ncbi:hypothetical protein VKT23_006013 [Stygiomarasmius scandens]|uniref:Uncharacterized protein n=1 Tax=Marasmiellus scandens TaxID=2682957 RepID=A0ABR1JSB7_9AGAR
MNATSTAILKTSSTEKRLALADCSQPKESKFVEMFEDEEDCLQVPNSSMPSTSELPCLGESLFPPQNVVTEDEGELEFDSYYFGKYDEEDQEAEQENHYIIPLNYKASPSPEALLAGAAELEKENIPLDPSCQVDFDPNDYFWDVWPQPLYVYDGRTKTKFLSAATIAQHQLRIDKEAARKEKKSKLRKVFGNFSNKF